MTEHHFQLGANRRNRKKEKIAIRGITHIFFNTTSSADDSLRKTVAFIPFRSDNIHGLNRLL